MTDMLSNSSDNEDLYWLRNVWSARSSSSTVDFRWNLKPSIFLFKLLGIRLDVFRNFFRTSMACGLVGFLSLLFNFVVHFASLEFCISRVIAQIELFSNDSSEGRKQQLLDLSPKIFRAIVLIVLGTGSHLLLLVLYF